MALSEETMQRAIRRLLLSRMRILCNHGFFGLLLMHMRYAIDEDMPTACTDGARIEFGPKFLEELSESELDFVMMHEILHVVLQHCFRANVQDIEAHNIACDIVVNSIIKLENGGSEANISLKNYGVSMHLAPDGKEGYVYTAEEVYEMLPHKLPKTGNRISKFVEGRAKQERSRANASALRTWDDHSRWNALEEDDVLRDVWVKRVEDAAEAIKNREAATGRGLLPMFAKRLLKEIRKPQTDWRTILNDFVQEEIADYSFSPPDRRFDDSPFFLPDFNEKEDTLKDILFMIDTSGSISDDMIAAAYSEVKDAIDQFDGKLKGWLGLSLSKKSSIGWAFSLRCVIIKRVMKDAGTRETGSGRRGDCRYREPGAKGASSSEDRCSRGLQSVI